MTERELKKIRRQDLLEMLLEQSREMEILRQELEAARTELENRKILMEESGNIAEAALRLYGVFEAAQAAADHYIQATTENARTIEERCKKMEESTRKRCSEMVHEAQSKTEKIWNDFWDKSDTL